MSPTKSTARKPVRKIVRKPAKRTTPVKRVTKLAKPVAPPKWSADIKDINVVWYNTSDFDRAKKFYTEVLGLPIAYDAPEMGWIEFGYPNQAHIAINLWRDQATKPPALGGATVTFSCDDVRGTLEHLQSQGIKCDTPDEIPGVVILASFYDPDGNRLQLAQSLEQ
jgi:predicted enzyme related to lactoylglutathione lyase